MLETYYKNHDYIKSKFKSAFKDILEDIDEIMEDDYDLTVTISSLLSEIEVNEIVDKLSKTGISVVYVVENDQSAEIYEENNVIKADFVNRGQIDDKFVEYFTKRAEISKGNHDLAIFDLWYL